MQILPLSLIALTILGTSAEASQSKAPKDQNFCKKECIGVIKDCPTLQKCKDANNKCMKDEGMSRLIGSIAKKVKAAIADAEKKGVCQINQQAELDRIVAADRKDKNKAAASIPNAPAKWIPAIPTQKKSDDIMADYEKQKSEIVRQNAPAKWTPATPTQKKSDDIMADYEKQKSDIVKQNAKPSWMVKKSPATPTQKMPTMEEEMARMEKESHRPMSDEELLR